ncbi:hypothetical protein DYBT9275_06017 [Dyadobacter sp. CECT 9275]|uniref:NADP-dependent oxidoreductase domain-containing protein n=1 Tax=Dyadobacter helix TaxID=2822344 RepID=A0A916JJ73_9BACT|nr:aldo/keto reductase [Dyadobacter sp. CECT 9275]CAG5018515.1 hypothetical protein DYBT9275_06017 [Dyadobacter sp. CECT 9275]
MKYSTFGSYQFSQLTLGTVQLGMNYGISNEAGQPGLEERSKMLKLTVASGINTFDTARQYGNSEEVLGEFIQNSAGGKGLNLVSKFKIHSQNLSHPERAWQEVYASVRQSLTALGIAKLPVCLLHKGEEPVREVMKVLPEMIRRLKAEGMIDIGGISAYFPEDIPWFSEEDEIIAAQIPLNIFDQRLIKNGGLSQLEKAGKLVFVRSVFLQGLFFMSPDHLSGRLYAAKPHLVQLAEFAEKAEMSIAQLAFTFVRDLPGVSSIVFGAVNETQIRENLELLRSKSVHPELLGQISAAFSDIPEDIVTPGRWK